MNIGIVLAAGVSERFQSKVHKQYLKLNGKEVIYYALNEMHESDCFDKIITVVDEEEYKCGYIAKKYNVECVPGGDKRNKSIKSALNYIKDTYKDVQKIVIHDCARPFVKSATFRKFIELLDEYEAVIMTATITDSLGWGNGEFIDRKNYFLIQTPECFYFEDIYSWFREESPYTAVIHQKPHKEKVYLYNPKGLNLKITYPEELFLAEQFMRIDFLHTAGIEHKYPPIEGKVLLFGGSGGVGQALSAELEKTGVTYYAPSHSEIDLCKLSVDTLRTKVTFSPDVIINVAAAYADDSAGIVETYDTIFDINLRANLVLMEYCKTLGKRVNLVLMSSSSSTRGRENLTNYSAAKAALNSVVESQGNALFNQNIYVNAIIPEKVNTPLIEKLHKQAIDRRELLNVEEVINTVLFYATTDQHGKLIHLRKGL